MQQTDALWLMVGLTGQFLFSMRFVLQWLKSERLRKSVVPTAFWYFSIAGGSTLFIYAIHIGDPVFILGQGLGVAIYLRNLQFIIRDKKIRVNQDLAASSGEHGRP
jgi:lipid-A-disaccharide synthase-like uncharacterized protein